MKDCLIAFEKMEWKMPKNGLQQKIFTKGFQQLCMVKFTDTFVEEQWCPKGHVGYVM